MFLSVTNLKSTSVAQLSVNPKTNQALVRYVGNNQPYLYSNISFNVLSSFLVSECESFGKWVNDNLKNNEQVTCFTV